MEAAAKSRSGGGLWNNPRVTQHSRETQDRLRLMRQESKLNNLQRQKISKDLKNEAKLQLTSNLTSSASPPKTKPCKSAQKGLPGVPRRRSAESCRSGGNYTRDKFHPGPTRDLEKEKRRLQSILASGQEETEAAIPEKVSACEEPEEKDRFEEVLDEIEERRQFLADMASLGQEERYIDLINSEISQKFRELEVLEKKHNLKMNE